jgi:plasmid maintenance system killer protein
MAKTARSFGIGADRFANVRFKGVRRSQWAMSVKRPWRICFEFRRGDAYDVEIVDYHKG